MATPFTREVEKKQLSRLTGAKKVSVAKKNGWCGQNLAHGDRADGLFCTCAAGDKNSIAADTFGDFSNNIGK